jgi:sodium/potassium-transporting ATPase subunit alpha
MMATQARVIRDGHSVVILAEEVVVGDIVVLQAGDKICADCRVIACDGLRVDNSNMTGESEPVQCGTAATSPVPTHTKNLVWSGSLAVDGQGLGLVVATGDDTLIGRVATLAGVTKHSKSHLQMEISHFVRVIFVLAVAMGGLILVLGLSKRYPVLGVIVAAVGVLLGNVPQGLPPAVTSVLGITAAALSKKSVFVKKLDIVETLGSCTVIASDKTGTLTQNKMTAAEVWPSRSPTQQQQQLVQDTGSWASLARLRRVLVLCNRVEVGPEVRDLAGVDLNGDASEVGLFRKAFELGDVYRSLKAEHPKVTEVPFNSVNKFQLSVHSCPSSPAAAAAEGSPFLLALKGAPEIVLGMCAGGYVAEDGSSGPASEAHSSFVKAAIVSFAEKGQRVLGFAEALISEAEAAEVAELRAVPASVRARLAFVGLVTLLDPPKEGVREAVRLCRLAGIRVIMVTGDFIVTAKAIARDIGILEEDGGGRAQPLREPEPCYTGGEVDALGSDKSAWDAVLAHRNIVFARMLPEHKLRIVEELQKRGEIVAVTGDGVNDSPALKRADVGIAMGIAGSEVAKEASKIILADDSFASIVVAIQYGRLIFDNLRKTVAFVLTHLIPEAVPFLLTYAFGLPLGLSSILLLTIDLGTEMLPSVSLAYELPEGDIMRLPPKRQDDRLVSFPVLSHAYLEVGVIESLLCVAGYFLLFEHYGIPSGVVSRRGRELFARGSPDLVSEHGRVLSAADQVNILLEVQTGWFATLACMQLAHVFAARSIRDAAWHSPVNRRLCAGVACSLALVILIIYTPGLNRVLYARPFPPVFWLWIMLFMVTVFAYVEGKKYLLRTINAARPLQEADALTGKQAPMPIAMATPTQIIKATVENRRNAEPPKPELDTAKRDLLGSFV